MCLNDEIKHMDSIVSNFTQCLKIITYLLLKICLCLGIFERQKKKPKKLFHQVATDGFKTKTKNRAVKEDLCLFFFFNSCEFIGVL